MAKITIIVGHPRAGSFCEALGKAYLRGAQAGGHKAKLFVLAEMQFDAVLREGYHRLQALEPDLVAAREAFIGCDHVVFIFPLWCGGMPAIMKGFIERIMQPDLLALHARVIMTMGIPGWFYRWY